VGKSLPSFMDGKKKNNEGKKKAEQENQKGTHGKPHPKSTKPKTNERLKTGEHKKALIYTIRGYPERGITGKGKRKALQETTIEKTIKRDLPRKWERGGN